MATHEVILILGPEDDGRPISADEFAEAEFLGPWRYERDEGRLVVMPPDGYEHQVTSEPWRDHLSWYKREHPDLVAHVFSNPWVRVDEQKDRIGDIGVYLVPVRRVGPHPEPLPDLLFEIVSPGRRSRDRDYVEKPGVYFKLGIREYVVIDRFSRTVTAFTLGPDGYQERLLTEVDIYTSPLLPGLAIALAGVL